MKRIVIVLAIVVIAFPMTVLAQKRNTVQGAMTITTTTIVQQEKPEKPKKEKKEKKSFNPVKSGWQQSVEVGLNMGFGDYWLWDVGVHYAGGYRINNTFYVGFKTGLDFVVLDDAREEYYYSTYYCDEDKFFRASSVVMLPIYVHFRAYLTKTRLQPFFALSGGAKIGFKKPTEAVLGTDLPNWTNEQSKVSDIKASPVNYCVEPAFGLNLRVSNRSSVYMQLGAPLQIRPYYKPVSPYRGSISRRLSPGFSIRIGYTF